MASIKQHEDSGIYHLTVGTEVSAKYRGAFCEAQIKSVKKNVHYKVLSKKTGKSCQLSEESIRGVLKIGSVVEAQFPDQPLWQECVIQSAKDRSSYTVVFDDGDERTLSRGSLCLKGDRHYAKSETLDNLPLTDPENFGTPVLTMKKNRRRRPADEEYDDDSEESKTPDRETPKSVKDKKQQDVNEQQETSSDDEEEDENEKRTKWLQDPLMGKVVIVEPNDKRKHWFPALVVNPLCYERHKELVSTQILVRSFKTGKFLRAHRSIAKEMTQSNIPSKLDALWKGIVEDAQQWQNSRTVPGKWRTDIKDILYDSENDDDDEQGSGDENTKNKRKNDDKKSTDDDSKEEEKKNHDFLEVLYKFMEDRDTPINKTPVLGYKDLDLFLLYNLVQKRQAPFATISVKEWKQIYLDLGIPKPNPAAAYNVKTAYQKYLGAYEEYCTSWKNVPLLKKSSLVSTTTKKKTKTVDKTGKETKSQEQRKIKHKEGGKTKPTDLGLEGKQKGRNSPVLNADSPILSIPRRQRRRISESSSASDVTVPSSSGKTETKKTKKATSAKKSEEKFRSPGGPDSEPDDSSRPSAKAEKKESAEKRNAAKNIIDASSSKRIRRNSTSNVSTQYSVGDKLKVKYGQGKTFKLYDAKILQVKQPEGVGEAIEYYVHYAGWNARHDEWIRQGRIVGLISDDVKVPSSPASGSKTRRPKTPLSARSTYSSSKDEIPPSPVLSYQLSSKFHTDEIIPSHLKDDLPEFSVKPRFTSILKRNLADDLAKVSPPAQNRELKRSTSPVLASSNYPRAKRPRTPPNTDPEKGVVKHESKKELGGEKDVENTVKPEKITENVKQEKKSDEKVEKEVVEGTNDKEAEKASKNERERSVSPSEESTTSSITEASEDNSNDTPSATSSVHNVRRTSSRRSKSPAYLAESAWYAMTTKRKKNNSSNEKSRSPTPTTSEKADEQSPLSKSVDEKDKDSTTNTKSSSPATCASPVIESNDIAVSTSKDNDAVTTTPISAPKASGKVKGVRSKKKSQDKTESEPTRNDENKTNSDKIKDEQTPTTEYDNFDEEAPSIALEKHHDTDDTVPEHHITESNKGEAEKSTANTQQDDDKVTEKKKDSPKKTTKRKIQKRKTVEKHEDDNKKEAIQELEDSEKKSQDIDDIVKPEEKTEVEQMEVVEAPNNLDNANDEMQHSPGGLSPHPHNAPSSSKVLLENTPPTTPEQSPNYTSEDQDIEPGKNSPTLDSDAMDIPEEQKDSGGNSSSSGCEHHTADIALKQESETQEDDKNTKEGDIPSPPPAKRKRGRSRKRANTKGRGNRRTSYTNEQDTESEEEHDNETGETHRKRHESGSRCRPRKKRTKARPEPPSAPPPLPREELENMSQDERIALLQSRMAEMRKVYHQLKQEVANIDRKRKRAKRREREAAEAAQLQTASKRGFSPIMASKGMASKPEATSTVADGQASIMEGKAELEESG